VTIVRDVRRSLDFLASRSEIDSRRLAFEGFSWGAFVAPFVLAVEPRFAMAILGSGGLDPAARPRPEVDPFHYTPRVTLPVLMLNGRYDLVVPLDSSAHPMFRLLGTPSDNKLLRVYDSDHAVPRSDFIRESLAWLDRYLGPVEPRAPY
jgi:predicted esterase